MIKIKDLPPPENRYPVKRALLSVFDKSGLVPFAQTLHERGIVLLSTGGTARTLREAGLPVTDVSALTSYPEILDGRVKTLHPVVHGGLLARRNDPEDMRQIGELGIETVDLVVVNLYPFSEAVSREGVSEAEAVENIDIGGPTLIRAAAKNFFYVGVVTSPHQYVDVAAEIEQEGSLSLETRRRLAGEAFRHTASYDAAITDYFEGTSGTPDFPGTLNISIPLDQRLRYGENPHQAAALYGDTARFFETLHGKE
ncbi:MAG: bifunctional phosphoribosylaminoimidazolecarboxamide formyltransferase/IMP cyclohydrolase, partial [Rhodothermales bacterium]